MCLNDLNGKEVINIKDHVKCSNCGTEQKVEAGSNVCLHCGYNGGLAWVDANKQEIED